MGKRPLLEKVSKLDDDMIEQLYSMISQPSSQARERYSNL